MKPSRTRGASLATTLVFASLALVVGLALASVSMAHLQFSTSQARSLDARACAEGVLALAVERVLSDNDFGFARNGNEQLEVAFESGTGRLSFHPDTANSWGVPYSTNNYTGLEPVDGWQNLAVPPKAFHLVAIGEAGGVRQTVEVMLEIPDFPFALASSGPIESRGSLLVGGVEEIEDAFNIDPANLEPADLASNAEDWAVTLDGQAVVSGNIRSVGAIRVGPDVVVQGELRPASDAVSLARVDLSELMPTNAVPYSTVAGQALEHAVHSNGDLTIANGLQLDDGVLSVNGDLTIRGGVRGRGALLVNGEVTIDGGAALAAEDQVALVATGGVTVRGHEQDSSFFQGLIYTEGDLQAENITLLGAFVANREQSPVDPGSRLSLNSASVIHHPTFANFETRRSVITFVPRLPGHEGDIFEQRGLEYTIEADPDELNGLIALLDLYNPSAEHEARRLAVRISQSLQDLGIGENRADGTRNLARGGSGDEDVDPWLFVANALMTGPRPPGLGGSAGPEVLERIIPSFQFDLNEFLDETSRTRIIYWRER